MKTTSIIPVHGLASLILMSKYAWSRYVVLCGGFPDNIFIDQYLRSRSFTDELVYFVNIKQFGRHN